MIQTTLPVDGTPQGESTLRKNKFHFFKSRPISKRLQTNIQRNVISSEDEIVVKDIENNRLMQNILEPNYFLLPTKNIQTTNNNTSAASSLFNRERKETSKNSILNERSINTRSFKKLLHSFQETKTFILPKKKENSSQKEGTIFKIFSSDQEKDNNNSFLVDSIKGIKSFRSKTQTCINLTKNSENSLTKKNTDNSLPFTKEEKYRCLSEDKDVHRENRLDFTLIDNSKPCKKIQSLQDKNSIDNIIDSTEKTSQKIIEIYNIVKSEGLLSTQKRLSKVTLLEDLNEKTFLLLKNSLEDYLNKCDKHQERLHLKEEKIKILETELFQLKHQTLGLNHDISKLNYKSSSKEKSQEDMNTNKSLQQHTIITSRTENLNKKENQIYIGLKNLETKYDQLYNAFGCLENESQQVKNQNILLQFYRDKTINFLESLYQLFEGLLGKDCMKVYQTCFKNLISNYYLFRTTITNGKQIESAKSEIEYFFDEIVRDTFMKKLVTKFSLLTSKTKILEEQLCQYEKTKSFEGREIYNW